MKLGTILDVPRKDGRLKVICRHRWVATARRQIIQYYTSFLATLSLLEEAHIQLATELRLQIRSLTKV